MWYHKLLYLVLLLLLYLFSALYYPVFSVYIFWCAALFPIVLWGMGWYAQRHLCASLYTPMQATLDATDAPCTIQLQNTSILPINFAYISVEMENQTLRSVETIQFRAVLPPRSTIQFRCSPNDIHCGMMQFRLHQIRCFDLLHLFSFRKKKVAASNVLILPAWNPYPPASALSMTAPIQNLPPEIAQRTTDPEEMIDIRLYQPGDSPRRIHWKLTSRFSELMIKTYNAPVPVIVPVGLLYSLPSKETYAGNTLDAMLIAVTDFAAHLFARDMAMLLMVYTAEGTERSVIRTQQELLQQLEVVLSKPPSSDLEACRHTMENSGDKLVVYTAPAHSISADAILSMESTQESLYMTPQNASDIVNNVWHLIFM